VSDIYFRVTVQLTTLSRSPRLRALARIGGVHSQVGPHPLRAKRPLITNLWRTP